MTATYELDMVGTNILREKTSWFLLVISTMKQFLGADGMGGAPVSTRESKIGGSKEEGRFRGQPYEEAAFPQSPSPPPRRERDRVLTPQKRPSRWVGSSCLLPVPFVYSISDPLM